MHSSRHHWLQQAAELEKQRIDFIMVSVLSIKGSTPREIGARMLVTHHDCFGTVGGGHLEWKAIAHARHLLESKTPSQHTQDYPLGATLGQCCGGFVTLLFEAIIQPQFHICLFGAGHVGKAIAHCLAQIPCQVTWIDSREAEFPTEIPAHIQKRIYEHPVDAVTDSHSDSYYLILTHNHQLDFDLVETVLKRQDAAYLGVIGSKTKSARFRHKLQQRGFSPAQISQMQCPIGDPDIISKHPGEIAIAVLAFLLKQRQQRKLVSNVTLNDSIPQENDL